MSKLPWINGKPRRTQRFVLIRGDGCNPVNSMRHALEISSCCHPAQIHVAHAKNASLR